MSRPPQAPTLPKRFTLSCFALSVTLTTACGDDVRRAPLAELGAELARSPTVTRSGYNTFACTTCHSLNPQPAGGRIFAGAPLAGAVHRPSFWGAETLNLREAVERCWVTFMRGFPADLEGPRGAALEAWLVSIPGDEMARASVTNTWPRAVQELPPGDALRGATVYANACGYCHGARNTGLGRLGALVSVLPTDTVREHSSQRTATDPPLRRYLRLVTVEKVRHGSFLGYAGAMPPFSYETLPDRDLADILDYLDFPD